MLGTLSRNVCRAMKSMVTKMEYNRPKPAVLQTAALEERCILVNEMDESVGEATKRYCHKVGPDGSIPLHRAFSVFLFNTSGELLLQKRSSYKVTFPNHYTNTCCSHPLAEIPGETEEKDALGIKRAAQRRLNHELGIPIAEVQPSEFKYLTRIHYQSAGNGEWGEHEIDYVLFLQKNVSLDPNLDEVSEVKWVSRSQIENFVKSIDAPLTPWFKLILEHKLPIWWDNLNNLKNMEEHTVIYKFT